MECEVWSLVYIEMLVVELLSFFGLGGFKLYILFYDMYISEY